MKPGQLISFCIMMFLLTAYRAYPEPFVVLPDSNGIQKVDIKIDSFSFTPDHIVVMSGKSVEIRLRSVTSMITHNFTLQYPDAGLSIVKDVPAGKDVTVSFTPVKTGKYEFFCDKKNFFANHRRKGMQGIIDVVKTY